MKRKEVLIKLNAPDTEKKKNVNAGHRQRMRSRFLAGGLNGFQHHEILELLLYYSIPRRDTNKIAHNLMERYHSFSGVFEADQNDLMQIDGISESTAVFLKLIPEVCRAYLMSKQDDPTKHVHRKELKELLASRFVGAVNEEAHILCLDAQMRVIGIEKVGDGESNSVNLKIRSIVEIALRTRCSHIILAHNHPHGNTQPSSADLFVTRRLQKILQQLDVRLEDHYIVGEKVVSLRDMGYFDSMM